MNSKQRCLAALNGETVDRIPVFPLLMFFAQQRAGITYRDYACNGSALAAAQLHIYDTYAVDAITTCSDAFRITADLGADMAYPENHTPYALSTLVKSQADFNSLKRPDPASSDSRMADRSRAAGEMVRAVGDECLVLGWVDMPFAEACSLCGVSEFMVMLYDQPELAHAVLEFLTPIVIEFSLAQIAEGVPMIGAGDAAASLISAPFYREFALPYEQQVIAAIHNAHALVKLHICGNTSHLLGDMIQAGADLYNVDHLVDFEEASQAYGAARRAFKGNIDPVTDMLQASPEACQNLAIECIQKAQGLHFILSAGCEVPGDTPDEVFRAFCAAPEQYKLES